MSPSEREPRRTCLRCRRQRPRGELIRIVRAPDGSACFDLAGRLPGRGAWVCPEPGCVDGLSAGGLAHVLRGPVRLPPAPERRRILAGALERRLGNLLTIARRTRAATLGATGVRMALAAGRAQLLLIAGDLPRDAAGAWRVRAGTCPARTLADGASLGRLFGAQTVPVASIAVPGLAVAVADAIDRWQTFCTDSCDNAKLGVHSAAQVARGDAAPGGG